MAGLIGGSGSTGSSLLRQILNRNSHVFCGPETSLFCKPELYEDWKNNKNAILKTGYGGLRSKSWHIYRGFELTKKENNVSLDLLTQMIDESTSFQEFVQKYFGANLDLTRNIWLEKTPGNAYCFRQFLQSFPKGKIIHIYRNPYDTIASLFNRGFSHYQATCIYILNTSFALREKNSPVYTQLSYESLVNKPVEQIKNLCTHLDVDYEAAMLESNDEKYDDDPSKIKGWNYDETGQISKGSIGKFETLKEKDKEIIIYACKTVQIADNTVKTEKLHHNNVLSLSKELGYSFKEKRTPAHYQLLKKEKFQDLLLRTRKNAFYNFFNYPMVLNKI